MGLNGSLDLRASARIPAKIFVQNREAFGDELARLTAKCTWALRFYGITRINSIYLHHQDQPLSRPSLQMCHGGSSSEGRRRDLCCHRQPGEEI